MLNLVWDPERQISVLSQAVSSGPAELVTLEQTYAQGTTTGPEIDCSRASSFTHILDLSGIGNSTVQIVWEGKTTENSPWASLLVDDPYLASIAGVFSVTNTITLFAIRVRFLQALPAQVPSFWAFR